MSDISKSNSRYGNATSRRDLSSKLPQINEAIVDSKYTSHMNKSKDPNPMLPPIHFPKLYYKSSRTKQKDIMDSIMVMEEEIIRESQSLEELRSSFDNIPKGNFTHLKYANHN